MILNQIEKNLPVKPYCTNQLGYLNIRPKLQAMTNKYLQYNHNNLSSLIYDLDYEVDINDFFNDPKIPTPNLISINKDNGHGHAFYVLNKPVYQANFNQTKHKAYKYACRIDRGLTDVLNADLGYSKLIAKSVWNDSWRNEELHSNLFELSELADYIPQNFKDKRRRIEPVGLGRNCIVFDNARQWAYRNFGSGNYLNFEFWNFEVEQHVRTVNAQMIPPLQESEIRSISRSIAKYCWKNIRMSFEEWGDKRRERSIAVRSTQSNKKAEDVKLYKKIHPEATIRQMSSILGYSAMAISRYLNS